jgi:hypothetical protein
MIDYERAKTTPNEYFAGPQDVVEHDGLPKAAKIVILLRWRYDALQLQTARSENMKSFDDGGLSKVLDALHNLGYKT